MVKSSSILSITLLITLHLPYTIGEYRMMVYRLSVMMSDGTRFISDYEQVTSAKERMMTFFQRDGGETARLWKEDSVEIIVNLDKVISASVHSMDIPVETEKPYRIGNSRAPVQQRFNPTIHIGTIFIDRS